MDSNNEINFNSILKLVYSNKLLLLKTLPINLLLALIFYFSVDRVYVSSFTLLPSENQQQSQISSAFNLIGLGAPNIDSEESFTTPDLVEELFKSRTYAKKLLSTEAIIDDKNSSKIIFEFLDSNSDINLDFSKKYRSIIKNLINVQQDIETGIYYIKVSTNNPHASFHICNTVLDVLTQYRSEILLSTTKQKKKYLTSKINKLSLQMDEAENILTNFVNDNVLYNQSPTLALEYKRKRNNYDLISTLFWTYKQDLELLSLKELSITSGLVVIDKPVIDDIKKYPTFETIISVVILSFLILNIPYVLFLRKES